MMGILCVIIIIRAPIEITGRTLTIKIYISERGEGFSVCSDNFVTEVLPNCSVLILRPLAFNICRKWNAELGFTLSKRGQQTSEFLAGSRSSVRFRTIAHDFVRLFFSTFNSNSHIHTTISHMNTVFENIDFIWV